MLNNLVKQTLHKNRLCYKYDEKNNFLTIHIPVDRKDKSTYIFACPFCQESYKKNGTPYKKSKFLTHFHGDELGSRAPHCKNEARAYYDLPPFEWNLISQECIVRFE